MAMKKSIDRQRLFRSIEGAAIRTQEFQPAYILSLLRTAPYIREETQYLPEPSRTITYKSRLDRQAIINDKSRQFEFIMTEGALRWYVGSPELMCEQIGHLMALAAQPNIRLGVIPWHRPVNVFAGHAFHIYDGALVVVGTAHAVTKTTDSKTVGFYSHLFDKLSALAEFGESANFELRRIANDYEKL